MIEKKRALTWGDLFQIGTLYDLDISQWQAQTKVIPQDEGYETGEINTSRHLGHWTLILPIRLKAINHYAYEARKLLEESSLNFPLVDGAKYVPAYKRQEVENIFNKIKKDFNKEVKKLIENYNKYKIEARKEIIKNLEKINEGNKNKDKIIDEALKRIDQHYPDIISLERKFDIDWKTFAFQAPIDQAVANDMEKEGKSVRKSLKEMMEQHRKQFLETVNEFYKLVQNNSNIKIHGKTINKAKKVCQQTKDLNIFDDIELERAINKFAIFLQKIEENNITKDDIVPLNEINKSLNEDIEKSLKRAENNLREAGQRKLRF